LMNPSCNTSSASWPNGYHDNKPKHSLGKKLVKLRWHGFSFQAVFTSFWWSIQFRSLCLTNKKESLHGESLRPDTDRFLSKWLYSPEHASIEYYTCIKKPFRDNETALILCAIVYATLKSTFMSPHSKVTVPFYRRWRSFSYINCAALRAYFYLNASSASL
jgi:hypothetical protein